MATAPSKKKKKQAPKVVTLYNRYNDKFGVPTRESLEEEQRQARKRMAEITGDADADDDDDDETRHRAQVDALLTRIQQNMVPVSLVCPDMIPLFQYMVFDAVFGGPPVAIIDEVHDNTELQADKRLFFACRTGAAQAVHYVQRLAEQLCTRVTSHLVAAHPTLRTFHAAMRANPQLFAEHKVGKLDGAVNAWEGGQPLRADVPYTHLIMVHSREEVYVTREQGRVLLLCYQVYHFISLVKTMVASECARETPLIQARSMTFCETWQHLTGPLLYGDGAQWKWMNHSNSSFVKTATQLMEALHTAQKWIKGL